jgi:F-type H+-transporting ATPase subunit b
MIRKSQEEAEQIVADAGKSIEDERRRVLAQAQTQIADLAIEAASKIIGENVDDEKNRRLVDKFLSEEEVGNK